MASAQRAHTHPGRVPAEPEARGGPGVGGLWLQASHSAGTWRPFPCRSNAGDACGTPVPPRKLRPSFLGRRSWLSETWKAIGAMSSVIFL